MERTPLKLGAILNLEDHKYRILKLISENGGSSLVYKAENVIMNPHSVNSLIKKVVIKEFYPKEIEISSFISRGENGELVVRANVLEKFKNKKILFTSGIARQVALSYKDSSNLTLGCPKAYTDINGTAYSVLELCNGATLEDTDCSKLSICEIAQVMISLCRVVLKLHMRGELYLDIKPDNIFLFSKKENKNHCVALFDFDTTVEINNIHQEGFFSKNWSPYEQEIWQGHKITTATDNYAIGAVFYWMLTGDIVTDDILLLVSQGNFNFLEKVCIQQNDIARLIEDILTSTLKIESKERIENLGRLVLMFRELYYNLSEYNFINDDSITKATKSFQNNKMQQLQNVGSHIYNKNITKAILNNRNK